MKLNELKTAVGARQKRKRLGRGSGSGLGKTSGRGHKGQKARSGGSIPPWFEGGQMPITRRLPKRGFKNIFKAKWAVLNLKDLNKLPSDEIITPELLFRKGMIKGKFDGIKILGEGNLEAPLHIKAHHFSQSALDKIKAVGGKAEEI